MEVVNTSETLACSCGTKRCDNPGNNHLKVVCFDTRRTKALRQELLPTHSHLLHVSSHELLMVNLNGRVRHHGLVRNWYLKKIKSEV